MIFIIQSMFFHHIYLRRVGKNLFSEYKGQFNFSVENVKVIFMFEVGCGLPSFHPSPCSKENRI